MSTRTLALLVAAGLAAGCNKPSSEPAPAPAAAPATPPGLAKAPAGTFTRADNTKVALADELAKHAETVVVFYKGFY